LLPYSGTALHSIAVVFVLFVGAKLLAEEPPALVPITELPDEVSYYTKVIRTPQGLAAITADALVLNIGNGSPAIIDHPPSPGELTVLASIGNKLLIAGKYAAYIYDQGAWQKLQIDDNFHSAVQDNGTALLVGSRAVYRVWDNGLFTTLRSLTTTRLPSAQTIHDRAHLFLARDGVWQSDGECLIDITSRMPWAFRSEVARIQELADGSLMAPTNRGIYIVKGNKAVPVAQDIFNRAIRETLYYVHCQGDTLIFVTYIGGISACSLTTGTELWRIVERVRDVL
jgi:hypothetical protein